MVRAYEKDPATIYAKSFETVTQEIQLERFEPSIRPLIVRLAHACGMVDVADDLVASVGAYDAGARALARGAPVLCDCEMVAAGIIKRHLPADNPIIVTLNNPGVAERAKVVATTRSAAAVLEWRAHLEGAVVAIGNAPTALFQLLEMLEQGAPKPAVILGFPVGFVGALESKSDLAEIPHGCAFVTLAGRRGGSAMASAAVNALASGLITDAP